MVPMGVMVPEFDAVAVSLKEGAISPVFKTKYGYHLMEMIERKGDQYNARHILLSPKASSADVEASKQQLDSLMTLVRDGQLDFTAVAREHNQDEETKGTNGTVLEPNTNSPHWAIGDLDQRTFALRLGVLTGEATPKVNLRISKMEEHQEQMAEELADLITAAFDDATVPVLLGSYNRAQ